ncbi:4921_t:CDS:2, partial [Gigaspora rosea]
IKNLEWNDTANIMNLKIREDKSYYIYAGKRIHIQVSDTQSKARCTAGFPVIKPNGRKGMLTAGHCVYENTDPDVYTKINGTLEDIGDVTKVAVGDEEGNEYALIELHTWEWGDPTACVPKLDRNGILQFAPINSTYSPKQGEEVCGFGSFNGYVCGKIVEVDQTAEFTRRGDSGGPIFTSEGLARAHPVGHEVGGGKQDGKNVSFYMPIETTLKAL